MVAVLLVLVLVVTGCGRRVTGPAVSSREEVRMAAVRSDTVLVRDTLKLTVTPAGDTVGRERVKLVYRRETVHDTVMIVRGDTMVIVERPVATRSWSDTVKEWMIGAVAGLALVGVWRLRR